MPRIKSMDNDEQQLIARILNGDRDSYATLVDRYKDGLYRHCFYITHDENAADDMTQMAFIRAYKNLRKYRADKASFKTWLYVIASHLCIDHLRQARTLPITEEDYVSSTYATPEQQAQSSELYRAVLRLKPKYRTVVTLYYWHGYSYKQIASSLQVPIGSVRSLLHRAKKQLKEVLA